MKINFHLNWSRLYSYVDKKEFGDEIADAVDILTHDKNVPYEDYIETITTNLIAVRVKLADLKHNMRLDRIR